jgi:hypothetical protein
MQIRDGREPIDADSFFNFAFGYLQAYRSA